MDDDLSEEPPDNNLCGGRKGTAPRDPMGDPDDGGVGTIGATLLLLLLALIPVVKVGAPYSIEIGVRTDDIIHRDLTVPVRIIGLLCKGVYLGSLLGGFLGGLLWSLFWNLVWSGLGL